ncbi:hypothetical protein ACFQX7_23130 [Luedemannella flava]
MAHHIGTGEAYPPGGWASPDGPPPAVPAPVGTPWPDPPAVRPPAPVQHPAAGPVVAPVAPGYPVPGPAAPMPPYPRVDGNYGPPPHPWPVPAVTRAYGLPAPVAVLPVPETPFAVAVVGVRPTLSGPSAASLAGGIAAILVSLVSLFFGQVGAEGGWGLPVGGAFAALAAFLGIAAIVLAAVGMRQIERAPVVGISGLGQARGGLVCGVLGLVMTAGAVLAALAAAT